MPVNFLSLPRELRDKIYNQLLVIQEPITCRTAYPVCRGLEITPGLLRTNKTIHREAISLLYSKNSFKFSYCATEEITVFLEMIGPTNASYILKIWVTFPNFLVNELIGEEVELVDEDVLILEKIQSYCTGVVSVTAHIYDVEGDLTRDPPDVITTGVALADARYRVFTSLQECNFIAVKTLPGCMRRELKNLGWRETKDYHWIGWDYNWDIDNDDDFGMIRLLEIV